MIAEIIRPKFRRRNVPDCFFSSLDQMASMFSAIYRMRDLSKAELLLVLDMESRIIDGAKDSLSDPQRYALERLFDRAFNQDGDQ